MRAALLSVAFCLLALGSTSSPAAVLAKVNGQPITDEDITLALSNFNEAQRYNILKDKASKRQVVETLVDQEILFQQAKSEGLDKTPEFAAAMKAFTKQYLSNLVVSRKLGPKLTEAAAKNYYENHKAKFTTSQIHLMQILAESENEAKDLLTKAKAPNADFQALAEKFSKDPSAKNNRGDLGFLGRDQLEASIGDAVFKSKKGEIVGPIKTNFGFHIIKVVDRMAGKQLSYDEVQLQAKGALQQDLMRDFITQARMKAKVEITN
jgi:peptidyl-prolyl cis-trans isomerase C